MFRFKELIELWRTSNSLTQALEDSHEMLKKTKEMFDYSVTSLRQSDNGDMKVDIHKMDGAINRYEQQVRHKILKHVAITGGTNAIPGLILTSIVIDIERIGDYTKNIKDLSVLHPRRLTCGQYNESISEIENGVGHIYETIVPIMKTSDAKSAKALMTDNWWMLKKCDEIVADLIKTPPANLNPGDAIAIALYARYLKRIAAHLINIASSVFNPFERIGFRDNDSAEV